MIAYFLFCVLLFVLFLALLFGSEDAADWLLARTWVPDWMCPCLRRISNRQGINGLFLFGSLAILAVGLPAIYEFPRWETGSQKTWIIQRNDVKGRKISFNAVRQLPWYGAFHRFSLRDLMRSCEIPVGTVRRQSVFFVEDIKQFKKYRITLEIRGDSWLDFLLDINNAQPMSNPFEFHSNEVLVTNNFICVLQQAQVPIDDVPRHAETLCNAWLESQNIDSVRAVVLGVEDVANPERLVWIQQ